MERKDFERIIGKDILFFNWMNMHIAFELFLSDDLRLRIQKDTFWRLSKRGSILLSSEIRMTDKRIDQMHDLLVDSIIQKISVSNSGDMVLYLSRGVKLELFRTKADSYAAKME